VGIGLRLVLLLIGPALVAGRAEALEWRWSYEGAGVSAAGSFTTRDAPDADGFYEITALAGQANGVAIAGLQPPGTAIPGNEGYPVDNLVRTASPQLSKHGFGYGLASGAYDNPFYGAHFVPPGYFAFFSDPANRKTSEPAVVFKAAIVP
jgi:hypothetical protein